MRWLSSKTQSVISTSLVSDTYREQLLSSPSRPTCINCLWIFISYLLLLPPPYHHPFLFVTPIFTPALHLISRRGASSTWPLTTPATRQPLPLVSAPCSTCLCLPLFTESVRPPPLPPSACTQVPVAPLGFCL